METHILIIVLGGDVEYGHNYDTIYKQETFYHRNTEQECNKIKDEFLLNFNEEFENKQIIFCAVMPMPCVKMADAQIRESIHYPIHFEKAKGVSFSLPLIEI